MRRVRASAPILHNESLSLASNGVAPSVLTAPSAFFPAAAVRRGEEPAGLPEATGAEAAPAGPHPQERGGVPGDHQGGAEGDGDLPGSPGHGGSAGQDPELLRDIQAS
ncbi:hypothetical protein AVEN_66324-1 [Araneus ventricosus]|uniref:Uncharacterized protein n=1 Tax=Araneus ventricosus TaxID=182803 RepID=A0A4Y2H551_ARAVE|nr:hypothetical protein AVEN_66324-1 [Araneus ventricosus]